MELEVEKAYNIWANQYDTNENKTRDLEALAIKQTLGNINFEKCLEIGCGTGKNTEWLANQSLEITAIDLSSKMLALAQRKINSPKVKFLRADIKNTWTFAEKKFDLITFSLVLEHIENLDHVFSQARNNIADKGFVYIGELHPFKQYNGTKAGFETENGLQIVTCFIHHFSDFVRTARKYGFTITDVNEFFDDDNINGIPRILAMLFQKSF